MEQKRAVPILIDELTKFQKPENIRRVERAKDLVAIGLTQLSGIHSTVLEEAKCARRNQRGKTIRTYEMSATKAMLKMAQKNPRKIIPMVSASLIRQR